MADLDYAPLVPAPDKIICIGLNYRDHVAEMGRQAPDFPTIFAKYRSSLIGAHDDIVLPSQSTSVDWEAELAVIIGSPIRHGDLDAATAAIAGYSVLNDVSMRDWQNRTHAVPAGQDVGVLDAARAVARHAGRARRDTRPRPADRLLRRRRGRPGVDDERARLRRPDARVLPVDDPHAAAR